MMADTKNKRPYAKYAFLNAYNLSLLGGTAVAAAATGQWWLAAVGAGAEVLWMLFAPDSKLLQRNWFDRYHEKALEDEREADLNRRFAILPPPAADRCRALRVLRANIGLMAKDNPIFTQDLLSDELAKLEQLVFAFVELSYTCARYVSYLSSVNPAQLAAEVQRYQAMLQHGDNEEKRDVAEKNLDVLLKRQKMYGEISSDLQTAAGQLDLIENTFRLLADQIVTMRTPQEMSTQLNQLIDGVEAIRVSARETEELMSDLDQHVEEARTELRVGR